MSQNKRFTNELITESSPYLLQHAHNPVNWFPWNEAAWNKAREEDKLVLLSIGYSSCHWCHVMERESFENEETAKLMNDHFICIKIDREERPDVDQVYMAAVQLMTGGGGWPLNCFCLPDGKPVYGGTYFPNARWNELLLNLANFYRGNKEKAEEYANELTKGINQTESFLPNESIVDLSLNDATKIVENWKKYFDSVEGGNNRSPKFPLPNNFQFLLHYAALTNDATVLNHVFLTLDKMAYGGIYDHVGGGFARYATDSYWKVPHFEKMLYDNAQLISLYSLAYQHSKRELYRTVVFETIDFIEHEMTAPGGGFFSALDADSEGEEGKFYVWTIEELQTLLRDRFDIFSETYNVNQIGYWEHNNFILLRKKSKEEIAQQFSITVDSLKEILNESKRILLAARSHRIRPGLDDKQLTSWNGLMIKALCDAYDVFGEKKFLDTAIRCANHILHNVRRNDGGLYHSFKNETASINGFLEDYSFMTEALLALYQSTFDERFLTEAKFLADYSIQHFFDPEENMFWFTSNTDQQLIVRKKELTDNVIPASNSSIAKALFILGQYYSTEFYNTCARKMLGNMLEAMPVYGSSYSNWGILLLYFAKPFSEIAIVGKDAELKRHELNQYYLPNKIIAGSTYPKSTLPLLENRFINDKTLIYVCENKTCQLPVEDVSTAIRLLQ